MTAGLSLIHLTDGLVFKILIVVVGSSSVFESPPTYVDVC